MHRSASVTAYVISAIAGASALGAARPNPPDPVCVDGKCSSRDTENVRARSAASFVDSIGVNVHFSNPRTAYVTRYPEVKQKLLALGVRHLRDGAADRA